MIKRLFLLVILFLVDISFQLSKPQSIQFSEESIEIRIIGDSASINGKYTFRNKSDKEVDRVLFYPFPVNQFLTYPDSIKVLRKNNQTVPFTKTSSGIYFGLTIPPYDKSIIEVIYSNKLLCNEMKYILTTTQNWKSPLQKAVYKISLPLEFELKELSFEPDRKETDSTNNIYHINKKNFMPDKDLIIKWVRRENVN